MKDDSHDMTEDMKDSFHGLKSGMSDFMDDFGDSVPSSSEMLEKSKDMIQDLSSKLRDKLTEFGDKASEATSLASEKLQESDEVGEHVKTCLPYLPKLLAPSILSEFNIPLNINDILLISFSTFPYIGWIFDIFMIFRSLLEKRWIYAILMVINWYQWFFWKIMSFGMLSVDMGPYFKLIYLGTYASKYFNFSNVASSF